MPDSDCDELREHLVDYADGELDGAAAAKLTRHLESCTGCRERLDALRHSLGLARRIWEESAAQLEAHSGARTVKRARRLPWRRGLAIAAAIGVVLIVSPRFQPPQKPAVPEPQAISLAEVKYEIWQAGMAQQLLVVADMFAGVRGGEPYAQDRLQSIVDLYPKTEAAKEARLRLAKPKERVVP